MVVSRGEIARRSYRSSRVKLYGNPLPLIAGLKEDVQQGRSVLRSVTGDLGFPRAEMSEFIRDNPNWRLSHAGVAIGDFALDP